MDCLQLFVVYLLVFLQNERCSTLGVTSEQYVGCYEEPLLGNTADTPWRTAALNLTAGVTTTDCVTVCRQLGHNYAGLEAGVRCWCGARRPVGPWSWACYSGTARRCQDGSAGQAEMCGGPDSGGAGADTAVLMVFAVCPPGWSGVHCDNHCDCRHGNCTLDGLCVEARDFPNFAVNSSIDCPRGNASCPIPCPAGCLDGQCHRRHGYCLHGCVDNAFGPFCLRSDENLALGRPAFLSSVGWGSSAGLPVDGVETHELYLSGTHEAQCTHTVWERTPWWYVDLGAVYSVQAVTIYNRKTHINYLNRFDVRLTSQQPQDVKKSYGEYSTCVRYHGTATLLINVTCQAPEPEGRYLVVLLPEITKYLHLCEVKVFQKVCPESSPGDACPFCENCATGACDVSTHDDTATCFLGCPKHWRGVTCQGCKAGKWGPDCLTDCPARCNSTCQQSTGVCDGCDAGYSGEFCNITCPTNCREGSCSQQTGTCTDGCLPGHFGGRCELSCPSHCLEDTCDHYNGTCENCVRGRYGQHCQHDCADCDDCDMMTGECTTSTSISNFGVNNIILASVLGILLLGSLILAGCIIQTVLSSRKSTNAPEK